MPSHITDPEREARPSSGKGNNTALAEDERPGGLCLSQLQKSVGGIRKGMGDRSAQNRHGHREVEEGCHRICLEGRCPQGRGEPTLGATLSILLSAGIMKGTLFLETNLPSSLLPFPFDEIPGGQFFLSLSIVSNYKK